MRVSGMSVADSDWIERARLSRPALMATEYRGVRAQRRPPTPHLGRHVAVLPVGGVEVGVRRAVRGMAVIVIRRTPARQVQGVESGAKRCRGKSWIQIYPSSSAHPSRR